MADDAGESKQREQIEVQKLVAETALIRQQLSSEHRWTERIRAISGLAGIITAFAVLMGVIFSYCQFSTTMEIDRRTQTITQANRIIELVLDQSETKRLAGIASLPPFLRDNDTESGQRILEVLAHILSVEEKPAVYDAIVSTLSRLDSAVLSSNGLERILDALIVANQSLVSQYNLRAERRGDARAEVHPPEARAARLAQAIVRFLRIGVARQDLREIYCVECDFTGLELPGANFNDSILSLSDFSNASLVGASFDGADIEGTSFVSADLRGAQFTYEDDPRRPGKLSYIKQLLFRDDREKIFIEGPNFNCADLREANFTGHPIFGFVTDYDEVEANDPPLTITFYASFVGADLVDANFANAQMFGAQWQEHGLPFSWGGGQAWSFPSGRGYQAAADYYFLFEYDFGSFSSPKPPEPKRYQISLSRLLKNFTGSSWEQASLPSPMKDWLQENPPGTLMDFGMRGKCTPRSDRPGFAPKARYHFRQSIGAGELDRTIETGQDEELIDLVLFLIRTKNGSEAAPLEPHERIFVSIDDVLDLAAVGALSQTISRRSDDVSEILAASEAFDTVGIKQAGVALEEVASVLARSASGTANAENLEAAVARAEEIIASRRKDTRARLAQYVREHRVEFVSGLQPNSG